MDPSLHLGQCYKIWLCSGVLDTARNALGVCINFLIYFSDQIDISCTINSELESPSLALNDAHLVLTKAFNNPIFLMDLNTGQAITKISFSEASDDSKLVLPVYIDSKVVALCNQSFGTAQLYDTRQSRVLTTDMGMLCVLINI